MFNNYSPKSDRYVTLYFKESWCTHSCYIDNLEEILEMQLCNVHLLRCNKTHS